MATTSTRATLHALVDELPHAILDETVLYLKALRDGERLVLRALSAPFSDEELTEEEIASLDEADAEFARGEYVSDKDLDRELGW